MFNRRTYRHLLKRRVFNAHCSDQLLIALAIAQFFLQFLHNFFQFFNKFSSFFSKICYTIFSTNFPTFFQKKSTIFFKLLHNFAQSFSQFCRQIFLQFFPKFFTIFPTNMYGRELAFARDLKSSQIIAPVPMKIQYTHVLINCSILNEIIV